jgi:hypothetical protein
MQRCKPPGDWPERPAEGARRNLKKRLSNAAKPTDGLDGDKPAQCRVRAFFNHQHTPKIMNVLLTHKQTEAEKVVTVPAQVADRRWEISETWPAN